ncbi:MAG: Hsp20/alpha crystallin family protein [Bacillota bacterium]
MALIPYEPFRPLETLRRGMDRFWQDFPFAPFGLERDFTGPRVDVYETDQEVIASCEIPGLEKKEDVHINIDNGVLTISGVIQRGQEVREEQMHRRERFVGRFQRSFSLPAPVDEEKTTASYRNGILEIRMPKAKGAARRSIDVQFH